MAWGSLVYRFVTASVDCVENLGRVPDSTVQALDRTFTIEAQGTSDRSLVL